MAALRAEVDRTSITQAARHLNRSKAMVSLILAGKYRHDTRAFAARVRARLMTPKRPRQLRALDAQLHRELRDLVDAHGAPTVAAWCSIPTSVLISHLRGTAKSGAPELAAHVKKLGPPVLHQCSSCGVGQLRNPSTQSETACA